MNKPDLIPVCISMRTVGPGHCVDSHPKRKCGSACEFYVPIEMSVSAARARLWKKVGKHNEQQ